MKKKNRPIAQEPQSIIIKAAELQYQSRRKKAWHQQSYTDHQNSGAMYKTRTAMYKHQKTSSSPSG